MTFSVDDEVPAPSLPVVAAPTPLTNRVSEISLMRTPAARPALTTLATSTPAQIRTPASHPLTTPNRDDQVPLPASAQKSELRKPRSTNLRKFGFLGATRVATEGDNKLEEDAKPAQQTPTVSNQQLPEVSTEVPQPVFKQPLPPVHKSMPTRRMDEPAEEPVFKQQRITSPAKPTPAPALTPAPAPPSTPTPVSTGPTAVAVSAQVAPVIQVPQAIVYQEVAMQPRQEKTFSVSVNSFFSTFLLIFVVVAELAHLVLVFRSMERLTPASPRLAGEEVARSFRFRALMERSLP